jgi:hypothetical protein
MLYSGLAPHTFITPHYGYTNAKLRCQLPLWVPGRCRLKVGDVEIEQREGRCIVFDDSFLHSAWNDSDEPRFVIVFDFFHPNLTAAKIEHLFSCAWRASGSWLKRSSTRRRAASGWIGGRPGGLKGRGAPLPDEGFHRVVRAAPAGPLDSSRIRASSGLSLSPPAPWTCPVPPAL